MTLDVNNPIKPNYNITPQIIYDATHTAQTYHDIPS